jgi:penicillin-binding protein-related factor A (putative recombinase)
MLEKHIQTQILNYLAYQPRCYVWRQNAGSMFTNDENGHRHGFKSASVKGISDIIGVWKSFAIAIEVKQPKKKPTPIQLAFLENVASAGGIAMVVHSLEELETSLTYADNQLHIKPDEGVLILNQ